VSARAPSVGWIKPLAIPYLRGFRARAAMSGSLRGYWFVAPRAAPSIRIFVGYLVNEDGFEYLKSIVPECMVFASVQPGNSALHRRLVDAKDSLFRKTFEYIRWLTHRHPRFEFHAKESATLLRRVSMRDWPVEKREHFSRNFFIETLCWLVRSALVRRLLAEGRAAGSRAARRAENSRGKPVARRRRRRS
jgi:hypothetical protein